MGRPKLAVIAAAAFAGATLLTAPQFAKAAPDDSSVAAQSDSYAQAKKPRVRPQIRVNRGYPYRTFQAVYPLPYDVESPGPNAVRQCGSRLVAEHRVAGTVLVPHTRCWWVVRR